MESVNDFPNVSLLDKFIPKAERILFAVAYLDEAMIDLLVDYAKKYKFELKVVSDINYNSDPYRRQRIRSSIESVGSFRTYAGSEGIMHMKTYVFYLKGNKAIVFNGSANFTANAWKLVNKESPITVETGDVDDVQLSLIIKSAEKIWDDAGQFSHKFMPGDLIQHAEFGKGKIFEIDGQIAKIVFGDRVIPVHIAELELVVDLFQLLSSGQMSSSCSLQKVKARFLASYIHAQNDLTGEFYDHKINAVPHQLLALKKFISSESNGNMLFADDVGLGKTIEAGLVIHDIYRRRGDNARVLILTPAGLKWQWHKEMKEKFGIFFHVWGHDTNPGAEAFGDGMGSSSLIIASQQRAVVGDTEEAIRHHIKYYDLVVVDECHRLSGDHTQLWQLLRDMRKENLIGKLLLLSATPHSGDPERFLNLIHLLDSKRFPKGSKSASSLKLLDKGEVIKDYIYRNDKLSVTDYDGKLLFKDIHTYRKDVVLSEDEKEFCRLVMDYIKALYIAQKKASGKLGNQIGFVSSVYRKMLASSWQNLYRALLARYKFLINEEEADGFSDFYDDDEGKDILGEAEERDVRKAVKEMNLKNILKNEVVILKNILLFGKKLKDKDIDSKLSVLDSILNSNENKKDKFIIFTQYIRTLEVIKEKLGGDKNVAEIQGAISPDDRDAQIEKFQKRVRFLVSTEAGGEGINLQFAFKIINYDMPWNPSRVQQRIGRVWRYGQKEDVHVYNLYVKDLHDEIIREKLELRMETIITQFLLPFYQGIAKTHRGAFINEMKNKVLGESGDQIIEAAIKEMDETLQEARVKDAEQQIKDASEFIKNEYPHLGQKIGVEIKELENYYASRNIPYLRMFADTFASIYNGKVIEEEEGKFKFVFPEYSFLTDLGFDGKLLKNTVYSFDKGKSINSNLDQPVTFFGYGDSFFNKIIELCRQPYFGGFVGYINRQDDSSIINSDVCLMITANFQSVATKDDKNTDAYFQCQFIAIPSGNPINPESIFSVEWVESKEHKVLTIDENLIQGYMDKMLENVRIKLCAIRRKDFTVSNKSVESAIVLY